MLTPMSTRATGGSRRGNAGRKCIGVEGRACGAPLPKRARKFCRRCRNIQYRLRRQRYSRDHFQANKVEIIAQRRDRRQAEREKAEQQAADRKKYRPAYEFYL